MRSMATGPVAREAQLVSRAKTRRQRRKLRARQERQKLARRANHAAELLMREQGDTGSFFTWGGDGTAGAANRSGPIL